MKKIALTILTLLLALTAGILWFVRGGDKGGAARGSVAEVQKGVTVSMHDVTQKKAESVGESTDVQHIEEPATGAQDASQNDAAISIADIDTSNWKEYCNEEYGFCVKYPDDDSIKIEEVYLGSDSDVTPLQDVYGNIANAIQFNFIDNRSLDIRMIPNNKRFSTLEAFLNDFHDNIYYYQVKRSDDSIDITIPNGYGYVNKIKGTDNTLLIGLHAVLFSSSHKYLYVVQSIAYEPMTRNAQERYFAILNSFRMIE